MRAVNRYVLRQLVVATAFVALALTFAMWLAQSLKMIDYMVNRGLPASRFMELVLLLLPGFLGVVLPISTAIGAVFVYNKLTQDSELVVMRAAGMSPLQLARPAILLGGISTILVYAIALYFLPLSFRNFKDLQNDVRQSYASVLIQEGVFNTVGNDVTVYVRERDAEGALVGIIVHDLRDRARPITLIAERGAIVRTPEGPRVLLVNGNRQEVDRQTGQLSMLYFQQYTVDLADLDKAAPFRYREAEERYLHELIWPEERALKNEKLMRELQAELHQRLAGPLYPLAFALIGMVALLSGEFNRRGRPLRLAGAGIAVLLLQIYALTAQDLTNRVVELAPLIYLGPLAPIAGCVLWLRRNRNRGGRQMLPPGGQPGLAAGAGA
jgi:lipopolysaccharide export system permease protein